MSRHSGWIKICGLTSEEAVDTALELRVDAIGFVFSTSVRRISVAEAVRLAAPARGRLACVAVFRHPSSAEIHEVLEGFVPDLVQTDHADSMQLPIAARSRLLPVYRESEALPATISGRLLFEGASSGSGRTADWTIARELATRCELLLAGGLHAQNVTEAIRFVRPFGVDVSSGVESAPGVKSRQRIHDFVSAARAAYGELSA